MTQCGGGSDEESLLAEGRAELQPPLTQLEKEKARSAEREEEIRALQKEVRLLKKHAEAMVAPEKFRAMQDKRIALKESLERLKVIPEYPDDPTVV